MKNVITQPYCVGSPDTTLSCRTFFVDTNNVPGTYTSEIEVTAKGGSYRKVIIQATIISIPEHNKITVTLPIPDINEKVVQPEEPTPKEETEAEEKQEVKTKQTTAITEYDPWKKKNNETRKHKNLIK